MASGTLAATPATMPISAVLERLIVAATARSTPAMRITNVCPTATIPSGIIWRRTFVRLRGVRKGSAIIEAASTIAASNSHNQPGPVHRVIDRRRRSAMGVGFSADAVDTPVKTPPLRF